MCGHDVKVAVQELIISYVSDTTVGTVEKAARAVAAGAKTSSAPKSLTSVTVSLRCTIRLRQRIIKIIEQDDPDPPVLGEETLGSLKPT